jgi:hypothetical protein
MLAADLRQDAAVRLDQEHVDVRIHVEEDLSQPSRAPGVVPLKGARGGAIGRENPRGQGQVSNVVVELGLELTLGTADPIVRFVDELPVQQPRQDRERGEHHDRRKQDKSRQLRPDSWQSKQHESWRA